MPEERFYLNRRDRDLLNRLHRMFTHERENDSSARINEEILDNAHQAPEIYIALPPDAGIPALDMLDSGSIGTGSGSGTPSGGNPGAGDIPGSAECEIFRIINGVLVSTRQRKRIYNLSDSSIRGQWTEVKRDKYGQWITKAGGTGGGGCESSRDEIWQLWLIGPPSFGSFDIVLSIGDIEDTITIDYNSNSSSAESAFQSHSEIGSGNALVTGGPFPFSNLTVQFTGDLAQLPMEPPRIDLTDLVVAPGTGTEPTPDGVGVIITRWQPGYSG